MLKIILRMKCFLITIILITRTLFSQPVLLTSRISESPEQITFNGDTIYSSKPTFQWHKVVGANSYCLQVDTTKQFNVPCISGSVYADTLGNVDTTWMSFNKLFNGLYYWRVKATDSGNYSEVDSFYVLDTTTRWYVRSGASSGNGSKNSPFGKIKFAVEMMTSGDTLLISAGTFTSDTGYVEPDTLEDMTVLGGWDTFFSLRNPQQYKTVFDGEDTVYDGPFQFRNNVILDGVTFKNYKGTVAYIDSRNNIRFSTCSFIKNYRGIYLYGCEEITVENCIFARNVNGISTYAWQVANNIKMEVVNNTFYNNNSIALRNDSMAVISKNNIFANNGKGYQTKGGKLDTIIYNSFFENDTALHFNNYFDNSLFFDITLSNSDSNIISSNNNSLDPKFVDTNFTSLDLHLGFGSDCFDAGDPASSYFLEPLPNGDRVNLGAFGGTPWASVDGVAPQIIVEPVLDTVQVGDSLTFSVIATGTASLFYQWIKNDMHISDALQNQFVIDSVVMSDTGIYKVIVTNAFGSDTSVDLNFKTISPSVNIEKSIEGAHLNDTITFSSSVLGTAPFTYQWLKSSIPINNEASPSLTVIANMANVEEDYSVVVYNDYGRDTSNVLNLQIVDSLAPEPVTGLSLTEVNCSTVSVTWIPSVSSDVIDIMIRASDNAIPMTPVDGEFGKLISNSVTTASLSGLPKNGTVIFISIFVKDSADNWSVYSETASDTILLSDGEAPLNNIDVIITNNNDTAIFFRMDVMEEFTEIEGGVIVNISSDSAYLRYNKQDTLFYKDTSYIIPISAQGLYYISWAPFDASGNLGEVKSKTFTLANSVPVFNIPKKNTLREDSLWILENFVKDYNQDKIYLTLLQFPEGMILDNILNRIEWTPQNNDVGTYELVISATDSVDGAVIDTFTLNILNTNDAPEILNISFPDTVYEDSVMVGEISVYDMDDGDTVLLHIDGVNWIETSYKSSTNDTFVYKISGAAGQRDTGHNTVIFKAYDNSFMKDTSLMNIYVVNTNDAPTVTIESKIIVKGAAFYLMKAEDDFDISFSYTGWIIDANSGDTVNDTVFRNTTGSFEVFPLLDGSYYAYCSVTDKNGLNTTVVDTFTVSGVSSKIWIKGSSWSMISIPSSYISIDSAINNEIIQRWDESKPFKNIYEYYNRISASANIERGKSYWLKNTTADIKAEIINEDSNFLKEQSKSHVVSLSKDNYGWNMIASPYVYPIKWTSDLTVWEWDETLKEYIDAQDILYPWKGYWVLAENPEDSIIFNPFPSFTERKKRGFVRCKFVSKENWTFNLSMKCEGIFDRENLFGINPEASDKKDRFDRAEPPRMINVPYIYFKNSNLNQNISQYASDFRVGWDGLEIFNVGIYSGNFINKEIVLRIEKISKGENIYLFVKNGEEFQFYNSDGEITVKGQENDQFITIFASDDPRFLDHFPLSFKVASPYPNPFKGLVNINYTLPYKWESNGLLIDKLHNVRIKIFDVKGRIVRDLYQGQLKPGTHILNWNGKNDQGGLASSGVYFVKINAGTLKAVKKIMVLK